MATYAIGDVQGCYNELQKLLKKINFDVKKDQLWFTGDLVNRGPKSLKVLTFVKNLDDCAVTVLGNHDLHFLAVAQGIVPCKKSDTFNDILSSPLRQELIEWLRQRPLIHHDRQSGFSLIHAGLPPDWEIQKAMAYASEVEALLQSPNWYNSVKHFYKKNTEHWSATTKSWDRIAFIINCFTRLRFCDTRGILALDYSGPPGSQPAPYMPWFEVPGRQSEGTKIVFGHWAALGFHRGNSIYALDTGCVWGGSLTALCLENGSRYSVPCECNHFSGADK